MGKHARGGVQNEAFERKQSSRQVEWERTNGYYENRRFGQKVRSLLKEGQLLEARELCAQQVLLGFRCLVLGNSSITLAKWLVGCKQTTECH